MKKKVFAVAVKVSPFVLALGATAARAEDLINYSTIATGLTSQAGTAIMAAVGVGVLVLGARMGWKFFKGFVK